MMYCIKHTRTQPHIYTWLMLLLLLLSGVKGWGQVNPTAQSLPYSQNFGTSTFTSMPTGMVAWNGMNGGSISTQAGAEGTTPSGDATVTPTTALQTVGGVYGFATSSNGRAYIQTSSNNGNGVNQIALAINTTGLTSIVVAYDVEIISAQPRTVGVVMQYRVGTSGSWITVSGTTNPFSQAGGTTGVKASPSITLPSAANNQSVVQIRWATWRGTESGNNSGVAIDNISVSATSATPTITGSATATAFTTTYGTASAVQNFSVSGSNLTANLLATAPTGFEVSSDGTTYGPTATFTQSSGSASGTLRIRLAATAAVSGSYNSQNIVLSSTGATNVNITTASSGNTVSAKGLTITGLSAANKTYDGTTSVSVSGTAAYSGLANSESFTPSDVVSWAFADPAVGTNKTLSRTGSYTAPSGNYTITQPTLTANITAATLTVTGLTAANKAYDGLTSATTSGTAALSGIIGSDDVTLTGTPVFSFSSAAAGNSKTVTTTGYTLGGAQAGNYSLTQPSFTANITTVALTISGLTASDKNFDGNTTVSVSGTPAYSGLVNGESFSVSGSVTWAFPDANVGTGKTLTRTGDYNAPSGNYTVTQPTLTASINAVVPTAPVITGITPGNTELTVAFTAPSSNGGASISNYKFSTDNGASYTALSPASTSSPITITGLTNNTTYDIKIRAVNSVGDGAESNMQSGTPTTGTPPTVTASAATAIGATDATLNGEVTSEGTSSVTDRGFVYHTSPGVTIANNKTQSGSGLGLFALTPTLSVNTRYYFKSYAISADGTSLSSELDFWTLANTPTAPTVGSPTSSTLAVTIGASDGNPATTTYAIQETTSGNYVHANGSLSGTAVWQTAATWGTVTVTGLTHATTYTFKTKARNGNNDETAFGSTTNGTTSAIAPSVTTSAATSVTATGSTLNGNVTADGGSAITERGFVYKTTSGVTISDNKTTVSGTTGTYNLALTSLVVNTRYYFRAYATNSISTTLGSELDFWTLANTPAAPTVNTPTATTINLIIGSGDGNPSTTTYAIQETTSGNYVQANGSLSGTAIWQTAAVWGTETVTGLTAGTSYTFRVKARNGNNSETGFGSATVGITSGTIAIQDFETTPATPTWSYTGTGSTSSTTNKFNGARSYRLTSTQTLETDNIIITGYSNVQLSAAYAADGPDSGEDLFMDISYDNGATWNGSGSIKLVDGLSNTPLNINTTSSSGHITVASNPWLTSIGTSVTQLKIRFRIDAPTSSTTEYYFIDDIKITGALVPSAPTLASPSASSITSTSATLGATISANGGSSITARGTVFSTTSPVTTSDNLLAEGGTTVAAYSHSRSGLSPQTLYYYAGYATNSTGTALSSESSFRTLSNVPTAQASGLTATTVSSTQIDLAITTAATFPASGATRAGYLVLYSTSTPTLSSTNGQAPAAGVGSIFTTSATTLPATPSTSISVTGLSSTNTYNFLIIPYTWDGTNPATYNYLTTGAVTASATTNAGVPTLNAPTANFITSTSATLGATVTSDGGTAITERGTVYSTTTPVTSTDNKLAEGGTGVSSFSHSRTGLSPQTLYYYAGYATSSAGTGMGTEGSFRTVSTAPDIQASGLTATAASSAQIDLSLTTPATFPGSGATQAGYVVIYSTGTPTLSSTNGQAPSAGVGTIFTTAASTLPATPSNSISVTGLAAATTYNFLVVPYTWDGTNAATYNYLTAAAPTATETTQAATYTWSGADNASWATSTNWTPNRTTPATTDILVFNSNTTLTITGVPTQTIGKLEVSGSSTKITLQAASSPRVLTIANSVGTDFTIASGCELNISSSNTLSIVTAAGATGSISGGMKFSQGAHTLIPTDANAVTFNSGSSFTAGDLTTTGFTGNAFGPNTGTTYNGVVFASGSTYTQNEGNSPFAITQPNSRVLFQAGSNFIFSVATGSPGLSGRTYGNLEINSASAGLINLTGVNPLTINGTLTITAAGSAVNFNHTGGVSIAGNISVASGQTLGFSPASANTLTLNGTAQQTIGGSGTLTIGSNTTLNINNSNGVALSRNLTLPNTLTLTSGTLTVGANTLTLNGSISRTSGNIDASNASATVVYNGSTAQSIPASTFTGNINNLTINNSAGLTAGQSLTISNSLTLTSGTLTTGPNTLTFNGSISRSSGNINASNTSATVVFSGSTAQSIPSAAFTGNINALTLDNSAGLTANQALTVAGALTLTSGTLTTGSVNLTLNGSISRTSGNINASNASTTVVFSGSAAQSIPASTFTGNINSLTLNNSSGLSMSQNLTIANTLTLTSGNLSVGSNTLTLNGGYPSSNISNIITTSSSNLVFNCTGSGPFALPAFSALNQLTINSSGQNYTLSSSPTISGDLTLTNGTLVIGARTLTYTGSSITRTSGSIDASNGSASVIFNGSIAQSIPASTFTGTINNLTLDNSSGLTTSQNLTIGNTLALTSGTLNIGATELTLNGSISRTSGNIDASNASATVVFSGSSAQSIPASTFTGNINNLTLNNSAGLSCSELLTLAGTLTLTSGALNISTYTLTLNGTVTRTSGSIRSAGGNITVGGSSGNLSLHFDQTTSGTTNRLTNLTVNRASSTITLGNAMQLTGTLNVTTGTLASAGNLTLVSNASGTARVAELVSGASITGNVTAEVYIPSVARRWRFLSPTVSSSTFNDWKGEMFIIGPGGSTNGFDASGTGSLFFYNEAVTGNSNVGWTSISNTTNSIVPGTGYRTFIYGDRSNSGVITNSSLPQSAVTINTVGPLNTGNFALPVTYTANVNVNQDGWNLVGNPFHSPFDWNSYYNNCTSGCYTNIQPTIWVFDATTNNYKSYNASISSGTLSNGIIPTGSAFWLKANAASPSVTLKEEYKTAASHNQVFKNGNSEVQLELRLDAINADFFILKHHASATANTDAFDISKMSGSVNIMSLTPSGQSLTLDCRPELTANDTVQLFVNGSNGSYTLKVNMLPANSKYYYLVDRKLSTTTLLAPQSVYTFSITNSDTTTFGRRFYMIVSTSGTLPVEWKSFSARRQQNRTQVEWSTATEFNASHFEVQRSSDNQHFVTMGKVNARNTHNNDYVFYDTDVLRGLHYYRIRQVDLDQTETFTHVVAVNCDEESGGTIVTSAWPTVVTSEFNVALSNDNYNIQVYDINGRIQLNDDVSGERIQISTTRFGAGMYFIHIVSRTTGKSETLKFIKKE